MRTIKLRLISSITLVAFALLTTHARADEAADPKTELGGQRFVLVEQPAKEERMYGLALAGGIVFGSVYTINAFNAYVAGEGALALPIAGPIWEGIEYSSRHKSSPYSNDDDSSVRGFNALMALDAMAQMAGLSMMIAGLVVKHKVERPAKWQLAPTASNGGAGLAAYGTF